MRNILFILAALVGFGAFAQTNIPTRIMLVDSNGVVKMPTNITRIRIGGTDYTNLLGFGLSVTNGQLSVDTTQLPEGSGGSSLVTSVDDDFEVTGGQIAITNTVGTGPLVRQSEAGSGGGGTNFINAVSADFEVLTQSLSLTNTTGTGALLRASSLSPYLLSATASATYATLESPSFTGIVSFETIQADAVQVPFASLYASANASSNLTGTLDGGSWTNLNGTEIRSGTVADARIDPAIARLASPAFTGSPTAPTASPGTSNTVLATTAFVLQNGGGGGGDVTQSGNNTFTGTNTFSGTVNFSALDIAVVDVTGSLTVPDDAFDAGWDGNDTAARKDDIYDAVVLKAPIISPSFSGTLTNTGSIGSPDIIAGSSLTLGSTTRTNLNSPDMEEFESVVVNFIRGSGLTMTAIGWPTFSGAAISSGTIAATTDEDRHFGIANISSASGANSGLYLLSTSESFAQVGMTWESISKSINTNAGSMASYGFTDAITLGNPTDGIRLYRSNNFVLGQVFNNTVLTQTAQAPILSNQWISVKIQITDTNSVAFDVWDFNTRTSILSETLTALPGPSRTFGFGIIAGYTNAAATVIEAVDKVRFSVY